MSTPPDFMTQLLQSGGLMGSPQQQQGGGLMGALMNDPNGLLGLTMAANSAPGKFIGILGRSALQANDIQQQNQAQRLDMMQKMMALGMTGQKMSALNQFLTPEQAQASQAVAQTPGAPNAPSSASQTGQTPTQQAVGMPGAPMGSSQTQQQPQQIGAFDISQTRINGLPPNLYRRLELVSGKDPLETEKEIRALQLQSVQQAVKPQIDGLDTLIKSDNPSHYVRSSPELMRHLQAGAQSLGIDLARVPQGSQDQAIRTALTARRNQLASQAQLGIEAPPVPLQTVNGALGSIYQKDRVTGKLTQVKAEEPLKDVIDPTTGMPTNVRASAAEGKQPFNQSIFGAANMSDQAVQFASDYARSHGGQMPSGFSRSPAIVAKVYDRMAQDSAASGDTMGAITARGAALKANGAALTQISKLETATNQYANTLDKNLDNLVGAYQKAGNAGSPLITKAYRIWQQKGTGDADTAAMVTWLNAVQGEYAKLKSGSLGNAGASVSAMDDAKEVINKNMNQGGIEAVAAAMRAEKENRVAAIAEEKQRLMGNISVGPNGQTPAANTVSPTSAAFPTGPNKPTPARRNAQGWMLHRDKSGNLAYVSPDGKAYQEVK